MKELNFNTVTKFENELAKFFGSPYAIAIDSCTHGVELSLRYTNAKIITCPKRTYLSIPFLANKMNLELKWKDENWTDYYHLTNNVIDAAVLWKANSYIPNTFMSISTLLKRTGKKKLMIRCLQSRLIKATHMQMKLLLKAKAKLSIPQTNLFHVERTFGLKQKTQ